MAAEQSQTQRPRTAVDGPDARGPSDPTPGSTESTTDHLPLSYRIERMRLHARVRALERELEASEARRRAIVERYERILEERDENRTEDDTDRLIQLLVDAVSR